ncbi:hypothetical protein DRH14_04995 [Candidatus Shapirobacteria bacterium]|nr:MAG: hypothetical protein DRH14_04995 [Candidatus Shapirobacteria bacterium]
MAAELITGSAKVPRCERCPHATRGTAWCKENCPIAKIPSRALWIAQMASWVEAGILPESGGFLDQPYKTMAAIGIVLGRKAELENEELRRQERKWQTRR